MNCLSIVIPNWNGKHYLKPCLDSLLNQTHTELEVIVVDNASTDGSQALIQQEYPNVTMIELPENKGFTGASNAGMERASGEWVALLNNDTEVDKKWAEAIISAFQRHPEVGIVTSKMLLFGERDRLHNAGDYFTVDGRPGNRGVWERDEGQYDREEYVFSGCGGACAYRRTMLDEIGLLDADFFFLMEDVDLSWRAQLGDWRALYTPSAIVYHHLSATGGGTTASYYDGRNSIILLTKNIPLPLFRKYGWRIIKRQLQILWQAVRAWRGAEARAHIRGFFAGILKIPGSLGKRRGIQRNRKVSIEYLETLLTQPEDAN